MAAITKTDMSIPVEELIRVLVNRLPSAIKQVVNATYAATTYAL